MDIWINWIYLWILLIIMEFFSFKSFIFLPWAIISVVFYYLVNYKIVNFVDWYIFYFFFYFSIIFTILFKIIIDPFFNKKIKTQDILPIWEHTIVQLRDGDITIHINGTYYEVISSTVIKWWDTVEIVAIHWNSVEVIKIF